MQTKHNVMDVAFILDKYFKGMDNVSIDVFDAQTLNAVYRDVVNAMTSHFEIEVSVLQALSYCLYEMMDNVHIHSGKPLGTAMTHYDDSHKALRILIADDGMGIRESLAENDKYKDITEAEALKLCLEDTITDGKGMGFGLYTTSRLVDSIGKEFILHSGTHKLIIKDGETSVIENGFWQGTLIYMEIGTGEEIDPNQIVDHREKLLPLINGNEKVVLDFTGVNVVSNSFADECIAKLLLEMPLSELKRRTTFRGLNPLAERSVLVALQRRYKVLSTR